VSSALPPGQLVTRRRGGLTAGDAASARQSAAWLCLWRPEGAEDGKERSEGPPPPAMVTVNKEVMGLLRRLVGALERVVEVLEVMEGHYKKMDKQELDEKVDESNEDEEEDEEEKMEGNMEGGAEEVMGVETEGNGSRVVKIEK